MNSRGFLRRLGAGVCAVLAFGALMVSAARADASQRYVSTANDLALRSGPGTQYSAVARIQAGAPLDIECQVQGGTAVKGSTTWDRLADGRWVADAYTSTPSRNSYAPGLAACGSSPPATTTASPSSSHPELAAAWVEAHVGQVSTTENPNAGWWSGWCETLVERAWSAAGVNFRYSNAAADYEARRSAGQIQTAGPPPRGALVFYAPNHVALSIGGGRVVSTTGHERDRLPVANLSYLALSVYRGWAMPG